MPTRSELTHALVMAVEERGTIPQSPDLPRDTGYHREDYEEVFESYSKAVKAIDPHDNQGRDLRRF